MLKCFLGACNIPKESHIAYIRRYEDFPEYLLLENRQPFQQCIAGLSFYYLSTGRIFMTGQKVLLITVLILFSNLCWAQRVAKPSAPEFNEHFSSNVPVSGNVLVGALYSSAITNGKFFIDIETDTNDFCLKVASIDGTYVSENDYQVDASSEFNASVTMIEYPTRYDKIISGFDLKQLAPLATTGSCKDQRYQHVLLTGRSTLTSSTNILFMISSGRSEVFMQFKSASGQRINAECYRLQDGKRTAYDTVCEVPASLVKEQTYNAQIARRKNGRNLPTTSFTLQKSINETE